MSIRGACAGAFLFSLILLTGCDAHTSVHGVVVNEVHRPQANAEVHLTNAKTGVDIDQRTDETGQFVVGITHGPFGTPFALTVSKIGCQRYQETIQPNTREVRTVVLDCQPRGIGQASSETK